MNTRTRFRFSASACFGLLSATVALAADHYAVQELTGTYPIYNNQVSAISGNGKVVGLMGVDTPTVMNVGHAFLYADGHFTDLGTLGGDASMAWSVNNSGQVVGWSQWLPGGTNYYHAFAYSNGVMTDLGTLDGAHSGASKINQQGQIVGWASQGFRTRAVIFQNGGLTDLGTLGGDSASATSINDHGVIVGSAQLPGSQYSHAFFYSNGVMHDLGALGGLNSGAADINNAGQIIGTYDLPNGHGRSFLISGGQTTDLGSFGGTNTVANAINNAGEIVGTAQDAAGNWHPFLYRNGVLTNLAALVPAGQSLGDALDLNDSGQIVAAGGWHAVLLSAAGVELIGLEAVQVIQDWHNQVPLVAGKPTFVRAHLKSFDAVPARVSARLRGLNGAGTSLPGSPLAPLNQGGFIMAHPDAASRRSNFAASLNFRLPDSWLSNAITLSLVWSNPPIFANEPAEPGGVAGDGRVQVSFTNVPWFPVHFVRVAWTDGNGVVHVPSTRPHLFELADRLDAIYPIARMSRSIGDLLWTNGTPEDLTALNLQLQTLALANSCAGACARFYYGVIVDAPVGGQALDIPSQVSSGNMPGNPFAYGRNRQAHEIGHCLGRQHAALHAFGPWMDPDTHQPDTNYITGACDEAADLFAPDFPMDFVNGHLLPTLGPMTQGADRLVFGYDRYAQRVMDPANQFDLMSYCGNPDRWISRYTYTNILAAILSRFQIPSSGGGGDRPLQRNPSDWVLYRGLIDTADQTVQFLPLIPVQTDHAPTNASQGEYTLRLADSNGATVQDIPFNPQIGEPDFPSLPTRTGAFVIAVPPNPDIRSARVLRDGNELAARAATAHAPTAAVLFPNGGEILSNGPVMFNWQSSDLDGDALIHTVQYSADGGTNWQTLAVDWPGQSCSVDTGALPGSTNARVRVIAHDGFLSTTDDSDAPFTVRDHPPELSLRSPVGGELFIGQQPIFFEADAFDFETDAPMVQWRSSLDGPLDNADGKPFPADSLSEGFHLITATATDAAGQTNAASVKIIILHQPVPSLDIAPTNGSVQLRWPTEPALFKLQAADSLSAANWVTITNAPTVEGNYKSLTLPPANAGRFFRLVFEEDSGP